MHILIFGVCDPNIDCSITDPDPHTLKFFWISSSLYFTIYIDINIDIYIDIYIYLSL